MEKLYGQLSEVIGKQRMEALGELGQEIATAFSKQHESMQDWLLSMTRQVLEHGRCQRAFAWTSEHRSSVCAVQFERNGRPADWYVELYLTEVYRQGRAENDREMSRDWF